MLTYMQEHSRTPKHRHNHIHACSHACRRTHAHRHREPCSHTHTRRHGLTHDHTNMHTFVHTHCIHADQHPLHSHAPPHPATPVSTQCPLALPSCHLGTHGSPSQFVDIQPNDGFGTILPLETLELDVIFQPPKAKVKEYRFELICKSVINR